MGTLLRSCTEVRELIELSFGEVSGVSPGIGVLDGSPRAARGRAVSRVFCPIDSLVSMAHFVTEMYRVFDSCVKN